MGYDIKPHSQGIMVDSITIVLSTQGGNSFVHGKSMIRLPVTNKLMETWEKAEKEW